MGEFGARHSIRSREVICALQAEFGGAMQSPGDIINGGGGYFHALHADNRFLVTSESNPLREKMVMLRGFGDDLVHSGDEGAWAFALEKLLDLEFLASVLINGVCWISLASVAERSVKNMAGREKKHRTPEANGIADECNGFGDIDEVAGFRIGEASIHVSLHGGQEKDGRFSRFQKPQWDGINESVIKKVEFKESVDTRT